MDYYTDEYKYFVANPYTLELKEVVFNEGICQENGCEDFMDEDITDCLLIKCRYLLDEDGNVHTDCLNVHISSCLSDVLNIDYFKEIMTLKKQDFDDKISNDYECFVWSTIHDCSGLETRGLIQYDYIFKIPELINNLKIAISGIEDDKEWL